jgi:hypothetical protein
MLLFTLVTWRSPIILRKVVKTFKSNDPNKQESLFRDITRQCAVVFCDIPALLGALFVFLTVYRAPRLVAAIKRTSLERGKWRFHCAAQFLGLWADLFTLIPLAIVFGTLWRIKPLVKKMRAAAEKLKSADGAKTLQQKAHELSLNHTGDDEHGDHTVDRVVLSSSTGGNPPPGVVIEPATPVSFADSQAVAYRQKQAAIHERREATKKEAAAAKMATKLEWKRRKIVWIQMAMLLIDVIALPFTFLLLGTLVRAPALLSAYIAV